MEITLDSTIIANLSPKGIMAYLAVQMLGGGEWTTAVVAAIVQTPTASMLQGLTEVSERYPDIVHKCKDRKWCRAGEASALVRAHPGTSDRYRQFVEDLSKFWSHVNPGIPFQFKAADGQSAALFLRDHKEWDRPAWQQALNNRSKSRVNQVQPFHHWLPRLQEYLKTPLNEYGRPLTTGGSGHGRARDNADGNRDVIQRAIEAAGANGTATANLAHR